MKDKQEVKQCTICSGKFIDEKAETYDNFPMWEWANCVMLEGTDREQVVLNNKLVKKQVHVCIYCQNKLAWWVEQVRKGRA